MCSTWAEDCISGYIQELLTSKQFHYPGGKTRILYKIMMDAQYMNIQGSICLNIVANPDDWITTLSLLAGKWSPDPKQWFINKNICQARSLLFIEWHSFHPNYCCIKVVSSWYCDASTCLANKIIHVLINKQLLSQVPVVSFAFILRIICIHFGYTWVLIYAMLSCSGKQRVVS